MIHREFTIPQFVKCEEGGSVSYARFVVEPFERGYGTTVGNSLRRVLLASLEGSAVTAIRIENIPHEFAAIPGVHEDVTDLVLNLKKCQIRLNREDSLIFSFAHKGEGPVTAAELFKSADIDVFNPDLVVFNATSKTTSIEMEVKVARGRGYVTAEHFELEHAPLGTVYLDANFSPVTKVNFQVEDARVGQQTDYDRLILDVWTNGSITPDQALEEAASLLMDHLRIFVRQEEKQGGGDGAAGPEDPEMARMLSRPVEELELSVRAGNCLKAANIRTIGDLVSREESEMLRFHNFGKKSLDEIKAILESLDLSFGMKVGGVTPVPVAVPEGEVEAEEDEADLESEEED
ncbi:MAG: DNA-directed RNA polymerase subunit alpha [Candidatus Hydrogenedentes bacterium]|nr:DNA-directed RNA polymerase subunit alpha [Candidatus Hydrogenedentota bacterium]